MPAVFDCKNKRTKTEGNEFVSEKNGFYEVPIIRKDDKRVFKCLPSRMLTKMFLTQKMLHRAIEYQK